MFGIEEKTTNLYRVEGFILKRRKGDAKFTKRNCSAIVEASSEMKANVEARYILGKQCIIIKTKTI